MSQLHYLSSPVRIETKRYGHRPLTVNDVEVIDDNTIIVNGERELKNSWGGFLSKDIDWLKKHLMIFDSELDVGIMITPVEDDQRGVHAHFTHPFVYALEMCVKRLPYEKIINKVKYINDKQLLLELLKHHRKPDSFYELYSCWDAEEDLERRKEIDHHIDLDDITVGEPLTIKDRQYIKIYT